MCQHFLPHNFKALLTLPNRNRLPWRTCNHEHFTPYTAHGHSEEAKPKLHELSLVNGLQWVRPPNNSAVLIFPFLYRFALFTLHTMNI